MNENNQEGKEAASERIKALEKHIDELEHDLIHDRLTGLKTRAFLEEEVGVYLDIIKSQDESEQEGVSKRKQRFGFRNLSLIFFDIDHFKKVNDTYGHDTGDLVLKKVAQAIRACLRTGDTLARWGGEEMVASLLGANEQDAAVKAEEVRQSVEKLIFPEASELKITISSGVASSEGARELSELVKHSDEALYRAKESGRNKVVTYSSTHGN
jgi:diguanylate cyclase (GGDEF)-like protein